MRERRRASTLSLTVLTAVLVVALASPVRAASKPRVVLIVAFDASTLGPDWSWAGQGVADALTLGLAQHPSFVQIETSRLRAFGQPEAWGESAVLQAARGVKAESALFGTLTRSATNIVIQPRLLEVKSGGGEAAAGLEPVVVAESDFLARLPALVVAYARTMKVPLTD